MFKHILLPTDGSELSNGAVEGGVRLAKALGARVTGLCVIVESQVAAGIGKALTGDRDLAVEAAEDFLGVIAREAKRSDVPHEIFHVRAAHAHEAILGTATARGCDLIHMASHGRRGIANLLLGSEAMQVVTRGAIPVLVHR